MTLSGKLREGAAAVLTMGGDEELTPELVARVKAAAEEAESAESGVVLLLLGAGAGAGAGASTESGGPADAEDGAAEAGRAGGTESGERAGAAASDAPASASPVGTGPVGTGPVGTGPVGTGPVGTGIHLVNTWERALRRLETADRPTLALVTGECTGPALEALLTADHRIADDGARLRLAGGEDGAWPSTAVHRLAQQIGTARARRLLLRRPWLDAEEAAGLDLLDETVAGGREALERAAEVAEELSTVPGREWSIRRRLLFDATLSYEEALGAHLAACDRSLRRRALNGPS
ncbi:enoyl-CoA hydratase/isomerase family protein [Streptomyces sp. GMY02]|uniref:enoyl-CoA-hydratase DpgB n=1 Tax=Streptomyces sp. GMY02 TaxID=1333528 RepID=UPI001C2B8CD5|nr:enoyl-CoA-hydratase DpgB [Streptomyces sp. GMY02]QXE33745.1 enoyl-CoA hydratase/isomerase family protein [Streptomyces sp. GMY02]